MPRSKALRFIKSIGRFAGKFLSLVRPRQIEMPRISNFCSKSSQRLCMTGVCTPPRRVFSSSFTAHRALIISDKEVLEKVS